VAVVQSNVTSNLLSYYEHVLKSLLERKREALDGGLFRRSVDKKDLDLQWIPINLCLQEFFVNDTNRDEGTHILLYIVLFSIVYSISCLTYDSFVIASNNGWCIRCTRDGIQIATDTAST
jgi:hypothetical protein